MSNIDNNDYITVGDPLTSVALRSAVAEYQDDRKALEEAVDEQNAEQWEAQEKWLSGHGTEEDYSIALSKRGDTEEELQTLIWDNQGLVDFLEQVENYRADTLIPEDDFEDYIRESVLDGADLPAYVESHIDWSGVADDHRHDYAESHGYLFLAG